MTRAEAAEAGLRKVTEMPCTSPGTRGHFAMWKDCRERKKETRESWCPRCVAADALEHLPE